MGEAAAAHSLGPGRRRLPGGAGEARGHGGAHGEDGARGAGGARSAFNAFNAFSASGACASVWAGLLAGALSATPAAFAQGAAAAAYAQRYAEQCAACHGARGTSATALVPHLGGQPSFYAITQLFLFREGRRNDHPMAAPMATLAKGMSDAELRGYSELIALLPPPEAPDSGARDAARLARGRALAAQHHCIGCHGADLAGGRQVPRIAGQREDYLLVALRGFRSGKRLGYTNAMAEALAGLGEAEIGDLAHFLAHFVAPAASAASAAAAPAAASGGGR